MRRMTALCPTGVTNEVLGIDADGLLWFGELQKTDGGERRVVNWTPVNTPKDGVGFTEPQLSFLDRWEKEARARIETDSANAGDSVSLAQEK